MDFATAAEWLPDLFSWLCEKLSFDVRTIVSCGWRDEHHAEEEALRRELRGAAGPAAPMPVLAYLQGGSAPGGGRCDAQAHQLNRRYFLVARCIDDVHRALRPGHRLRNPGAGLRIIREHFLLTGHYHREAVNPVISRGPSIPEVFRPSDPSAPRSNPSGDRLDQLFDNLLWIGPSGHGAIEVVHARIPRRQDIPADLIVAAMRFAVVPWAEAADSLAFHGHVRAQSPWLVCDVPAEDEAALQARARLLVERLNADRVTVAMLPELVVSPSAVKAIAAALRAFRRDHEDASLHLLVAGSGSTRETHPDSGLPFNECVVLDGMGRELWRQRKMNHYAMATGRMRDYGLASCIVDPRDHKEDAHTGTVAHVRDGRLGRMLVLICEDLAQPSPGDSILDVYRPDWVFSPVLDGALHAGRWVHQRPWQNADRFGANGFVATSLVLPVRQHPHKKVVGVGLCVGQAKSRALKVLTVDRDDPGPLVVWTTWEPTTWTVSSIDVR